MKTTRKLAAIFAVFILCFSLFCTVAYAAPEDETTPPPAESTETTEDDFVIGTLPPGTGTVVDIFTDETGRKFYTIQTPAGNTFYLIIDTSKLSENVYFLDAVQEKDLIALAENTKASGESAIPNTNPNGQKTGEPSGNQIDPNTEPKDNTNNIMMFGLVLVVLIVGGGAYFIKSRKAKKSNDSRDEYEADEEEYIPNNYDTEPEDNSPPWEDEDE